MRVEEKLFHLPIAGAMGALWSSVALADLAGTSVAAPDKYDLQEIVVTAEKRSSTAQKTPINMTPISGQDLQDRVRSASI